MPVFLKNVLDEAVNINFIKFWPLSTSLFDETESAQKAQRALLLLTKEGCCSPGKSTCATIWVKSWAQTSLVVQWLRLHLANARRLGSISGPGTRIPHGQKVFLKRKAELTAFLVECHFLKGFPDSSVGKKSTCNAGDPRQFSY